MRHRQRGERLIQCVAVIFAIRAPGAQSTLGKERQEAWLPRNPNMANHKSAIKRIRQNEKRRLHNRTYRNRARTLVKKARTAIESGKVEEARAATKIAVRDLDKLASRGVVHKRNAARRKSRLMRQLAQLEK